MHQTFVQVRKLVQLIAEMGREPSEKQLMEEALEVAKNASAGLELRLNALTALRYLVEPIDNAIGQSDVSCNFHAILTLICSLYALASHLGDGFMMTVYIFKEDVSESKGMVSLSEGLHSRFMLARQWPKSMSPWCFVSCIAESKCGLNYTCADVHKLGGLTILADIIKHELETNVIAAAEFALGTAASNNPPVQADALANPYLMPSLLKARIYCRHR